MPFDLFEAHRNEEPALKLGAVKRPWDEKNEWGLNDVNYMIAIVKSC